MKRRHTRKSDAWIAKKYFTSLAGNHWVFHGQVNEQPCYLTKASHVPIKGHVKIQKEANPYDPQWEVY
jgi:RNA-directed DNA polymerase